MRGGKIQDLTPEPLAAAVTLAVCWRMLGHLGGAQSIVADAGADPVAKSS